MSLINRIKLTENSDRNEIGVVVTYGGDKGPGVLSVSTLEDFLSLVQGLEYFRNSSLVSFLPCRHRQGKGCSRELRKCGGSGIQLQSS
jgi:hypothetical protein